MLVAVALGQGSPFNDHPVLGPVVVHLQRKACTGFHRDPFHLPAGSFGNAGVMAPGAVDLAVGLALGLPAASSCFTTVLISWALARSAINTASSVSTTTRFSTPAHHQAVFAAQVAVAAAFSNHVALHCLGNPFALRFPEGTPAAHVAPAGIQRQLYCPAPFLHHGHVNGHVGALGEGLLQPMEFQVGRVLLECRPAALPLPEPAAPVPPAWRWRGTGTCRCSR